MLTLSTEQLNTLRDTLMANESDYMIGLFNPNTETAWSKPLITQLKFEPKVSLKLILPLILIFPFHPLTGDTSIYNESNRYVSDLAPSTLLQVIKAECHENSDLKELYMRTASFRGEWDTSLSEEFTEEDKRILWIYRRRMTYTATGLNISSKAVSGNNYPAVYLLDSEQDPATGAYVGDLSLMHKLGNLVGSLAKNEISSFNESIQSKSIENNLSRKMKRGFALSPDFISKIPSLDSTDAKARRGDIRSCYPFSSPQPVLSTIGLMFKITPKTGTLKEQVSNNKYVFYDHFTNPKEDLEKHIFYTSKWACVNAIDDITGNAFPKDPKNYKERDVRLDLYVDFAILDYTTECTSEILTKEEKMHEAREMKFTSEKTPLFDIESQTWKDPCLKEFMERLSGFHTLAKQKDLFRHLKVLLNKTYNHVTDAMVSSAIRLLTTQFPLSLPLYTPEIKSLHSDVLLELFPEEMIDSTSSWVDSIGEKKDELYDNLIKSVESSGFDGVQSPDMKEINGMDIDQIDEEETLVR